MNKVILMGRIATDIDFRQTETTSIAKYWIAVGRRFKRDEQTADFLNCIAFGKGGEFANKYLHKGMRILINGRIQTGSYTKQDGTRVNTFDIVVEDHEFVESRTEKPEDTKTGDEFMDIPDTLEGLPFN